MERENKQRGKMFVGADVRRRVACYYVRSVVGILFITGFAKIVSAFGASDSLKTFDPVFGLQWRGLFLIAGSTEMIVVILCTRSLQLENRAKLVAWLGTLFLAYRFAAVGLHYKRPCGCLGSMTAALHVSPYIANHIMECVLVYMLVGSYGILIWLWRQRRKGEQ